VQDDQRVCGAGDCRKDNESDLEEKEQRVQSFEEMKAQLREQVVNVKHKLYDLRQSAIQKAVKQSSEWRSLTVEVSE